MSRAALELEKARCRIAELEAENERLSAKLSLAQGVAGAVQARAALSRTGAVKVKALVNSLLDLRDLIMRGKRCVTDTGPAVKPVIELAAVHILDDAANALEVLSALEPAAPEGQQEPVAWMDATGTELHKIILAYQKRNMIASGGRQAERAPNYSIALFTRPVEQPVAEAGIEAAARLITKWLGFAWDGLHDGRVTDKGFSVFTHGQFGWGFQGHKGDMIDLARDALKAAMEAGHG